MWKKSTDWIRYFKAPKVTVKYGAKALNEQLSSLKQSGAKKIANYGWRNFKRYLDTEITAVVLLESKNLDTISWSIADNYLIDGKLRCLYNSERSITYSLRRRHNLTSVGGAGGKGGRSSRPRRSPFKKFFRPFGPQFGLNITGERAPPLDPPLVTSVKQRRNPRSGPQRTNNGKWVSNFLSSWLASRQWQRGPKWCILKSWYRGGGFRRCFADGLNQV